MNDVKRRINEIVNELKQERDDLRVRLHLAKMEVGDEWEKIDAKLIMLEIKAKDLGNATAEASQEIAAAAKLLGEEVRGGFKKIAKRF